MLKSSIALAVSGALLLVGEASAQMDPKEANNYLCYLVEGVKGGAEPGTRRLRDQFARQEVNVLKPRMVCNPVDVRGKEVPRSRSHLLCYMATAGQQKTRQVVVTTALGQTHLVLDGAEMLCLPGSKRLVN